jgi:hypothetical protein
VVYSQGVIAYPIVSSLSRICSKYHGCPPIARGRTNTQQVVPTKAVSAEKANDVLLPSNGKEVLAMNDELTVAKTSTTCRESCCS